MQKIKSLTLTTLFFSSFIARTEPTEAQFQAMIETINTCNQLTDLESHRKCFEEAAGSDGHDRFSQEALYRKSAKALYLAALMEIIEWNARYAATEVQESKATDIKSHESEANQSESDETAVQPEVTQPVVSESTEPEMTTDELALQEEIRKEKVRFAEIAAKLEETYNYVAKNL